MNAVLAIDRMSVEIDGRVLQVNQIIEYLGYEGKVSSAIIVEFRKADPGDMNSVWMNLRDVSTQKEELHSVNVWNQHVENKIINP